MRWFKRLPAPPTVPNDQEERLRAMEESIEALNRARTKSVNISIVTDSLRVHNEINHYAQRVRESFGADKAS